MYTVLSEHRYMYSSWKPTVVTMDFDKTSEDEALESFAKQQKELQSKIINEDTETWQKLKEIASPAENHVQNSLKYVAGLDISYLKCEPDTGCVALIVCELPQLQIVYKDFEIVQITSKYVAGFLAAREAPFLIEIFKRLKNNCPQYLPQVVLIDGNGVLHPNGCGIACMFGIEMDIPTIGVAKNLFYVDGIKKDDDHKAMVKSLNKKGDAFPLKGESGYIWGMALRTGELASNPVYISVGHKISLTTAVWVVNLCSKHRIPEPIRNADFLSTEYLRETFPDKE